MSSYTWSNRRFVAILTGSLFSFLPLPAQDIQNAAPANPLELAPNHLDTVQNIARESGPSAAIETLVLFHSANNGKVRQNALDSELVRLSVRFIEGGEVGLGKQVADQAIARLRQENPKDTRDAARLKYLEGYLTERLGDRNAAEALYASALKSDSGNEGAAAGMKRLEAAKTKERELPELARRAAEQEAQERAAGFRK